MTTNEIELHAERGITNLSEQMSYAKAVSVANLLPQAYRGKPADIMLAMGLGQAMGLSPAESLYRIDVIQGKPTASAELIAANVRKAGHRLRVTGDDNSATAVIIRADDPEFEFKVTRDAAWAKAMGLDSKENYRKQRGTMLQWRAISAVARLACPEALYGVAYTPDEMGDMPSTGGGGLGAVLSQTSGAEAAPDESGLPVRGDGPSASESPLLNTSSGLARRMFALFGEIGLKEKPDRLAYVADVIGREVASSTEMTDADAEKVIAAIEDDLANPFDAELADEPQDAS
jgi:hypothetical protein